MNSTEMSTLLSAILVKKGMYAVEAETVAARMVDADRIGRPIDGALSILKAVRSIDLGDIDPRAIAMTISETAASAYLDANEGMGHVPASKAVHLAVQKAEIEGIAMTVIRNSQSLGSPLVYSGLMAEAGKIGFCLSNIPEARDESGGFPSGASNGLQPAACAFPTENCLAGIDLGFGHNLDSFFALSGELSSVLGVFHTILTSGLTGGLTPQQKTRGPLRERFEHTLIAINPERFAGRKKYLNLTHELAGAFQHSTSEQGLRRISMEIEFDYPAETIEEVTKLASSIKAI
ncbi:MAG: Ldh family oxidoreductase [Planctomycetaceae bacterium]|nr:Ldh family oxidoreductase [Planctomycetaceae bacterium]